MEEEVAAVEDDEVVQKGPDKKGRVLWVMSHIQYWCAAEILLGISVRRKKNWGLGVPQGKKG